MASRTPLFIGGAAIVIILAIIIGWLALRGGEPAEEGGEISTTEVIEDETPPSGMTTTEVIPAQDFEKPDLKIPHFDFDRYNIRPDAARALTYDLGWLRKHPDARIVLEGHSDARGTIEYNQALGDKRARSVLRWLARQPGINPERFETVSYGKNRLLDFGTTEEAHQRNRRVDFTVIGR